MSQQTQREVVIRGSRGGSNGERPRSAPWITLQVEVVQTMDVARISTDRGDRFAHEFVGKQPDGDTYVKCKFYADVPVDLGGAIGSVVRFNAAYAQKSDYGRRLVRDSEERVIWVGSLDEDAVTLYTAGQRSRIDTTGDPL